MIWDEAEDLRCARVDGMFWPFCRARERDPSFIGAPDVLVPSYENCKQNRAILLSNSAKYFVVHTTTHPTVYVF